MYFGWLSYLWLLLKSYTNAYSDIYFQKYNIQIGLQFMFNGWPFFQKCYSDSYCLCEDNLYHQKNVAT